MGVIPWRTAGRARQRERRHKEPRWRESQTASTDERALDGHLCLSRERLGVAAGDRHAPQFRKKPQRYRYDSSLSPRCSGTAEPRPRAGRVADRDDRRGGGAARATPIRSPREFRSADGRVVASVHGLQDAVDQAQAVVAAVPELGGQGGAAVVRRADAAAVRARAARARRRS